MQARGQLDAGRHLLREKLRGLSIHAGRRRVSPTQTAQAALTAARKVMRSMILCQSNPSALAWAPIWGGHTDRAESSASIGGAALKGRRAWRLATWLAWALVLARDWERTLQRGTALCCRHTLYHGLNW